MTAGDKATVDETHSPTDRMPCLPSGVQCRQETKRGKESEEVSHDPPTRVYLV